MAGYDRALWDAKDRCTKALLGKPFDAMEMAGALDSLNKCWDELTDCLMRQRKERDDQILRLINELAEAKKKP